MRTILSSLLLIFYLNVYSQGTCNSPDGSMDSIQFPAPSYEWLDSNGYCYDFPPGTTNFTACFTFKSVCDSICINSGWSTSGSCLARSFSNFEIYQSPSCILKTNNICSNGFIPGNEYVFCFSGNVIGFVGCQFNDICPYFRQWCSTVPIELSIFMVHENDGAAYISWTTSSEINNKEFELQKMIDGENIWYKVATISGAGNSSSWKKYTHIDNFIKPWKFYYYRLKQIDFDGNYTYSKTISFTSKGVEHVYYNQQKDKLIITKLDTNITTLIISDITGKIVCNKAIRYNHTIDLTFLSRGLYFITLQSKNKNETYNYKIIRQ